MNNILRDKVLAAISVLLILGGLYGLHNDWTLYALIIPFGWILLGVILDAAINGSGTRESGIISILCALILTNIVLLLVHCDKSFIFGRLLCCTGAVIVIIRTSTEANTKNGSK